jgi:hypothetical protein
MPPPEHESELLRIAREWDEERERHMVTSRFGRYPPSRFAALAMGVVAVGVGLFWTVLAFGLPNGLSGVFPLLGVLFIVVGSGASYYQYTKARRYQAAFRAYRRRRAAAEARGRRDAPPPPV